MSSIEAIMLVQKTKQCHLIRLRKQAENEYDAKPFTTGNKRGWVYLDTFTASQVVSVYENVNDKTKENLGRMGIIGLIAIGRKYAR